jgi:ABC-2 type transport system permease protein
VLGYLVIVVFVVAGAFLAFSPQFFTNNVTGLDQLSESFPLLLLFLVPAMTMSSWADEKKLGTEELLFTLPAADVEILLGKYLAALAVYTVALMFSLTHLLVLAWIGNPDWGIIFTTYFGYWLAGAALLSAGMFASVLTSSTTVAFVLGTTVCAIPIFIGELASSAVVQTLGLGDFFLALSMPEQSRDFALGMIPLSGLFYFISLTVLMLYLNLVFISRRHWSSSQQVNMGMHFLARCVALAVTLIGLNSLATHASFRSDMTAEGIYSLTGTTRTLLEKAKSVTIQAYLSPEVPRDYVTVRKHLIGLLRQIDQLGGGRVDVRFVDVDPFSQQADEAKLYGIEPVQVSAERDGRRTQEDVFLGVVVTSSSDEVIIPFVGPGTPIEYELTRSISTVSNDERLTVGILRTDAQVMSGSSEWQIVTELKQQYDLEEVSPDSEIDRDKFDVLVAVLPSSLTDPQMSNLVDYVRTGKPALILDDPFPWVFNSGFGVSNAPRQPKPRPGGMFGGGMGSPPPEQKADGGKTTSLLRALDIAWQYDEIVWDHFNPHMEFFAVVPDEFLFISPKSGTSSAFSQKSEVTSGLQEILAAFSGTIRPRDGSDFDFEALLRTGPDSGLMGWDEFTRSGFDFSRGGQPTARLAPESERPRIIDKDAHVIAMHITSKEKDRKVNVVYVADVDLISDWFFYERSRGESNMNLDNVTFVLNAVDVLAGDKSYLELRKRRASHRTLQVVEAQTAQFVRERNEQQAKADADSKQKLDEEKKRFHAKIEELEKDTSLDDRTKVELIRNAQATAQRQVEVAEAHIERDKQAKIEDIRAKTKRQMRATEDRIRSIAVLIPPLPAIVLGIFILTRRLYQERRDITPDRLVER